MCCLSCKDAYVGQNTKIRDTLNNLILKVRRRATRPALLAPPNAPPHPFSTFCVRVPCAVPPELADERR